MDGERKAGKRIEEGRDLNLRDRRGVWGGGDERVGEDRRKGREGRRS